jgi:hypothetical protein
MDPTWERCPYCEAEAKSKQKSGPPQNSNPSSGRQTRVGRVPSEGSSRRTKEMPSGGGAPQGGGYAGRGESRRIVGVLITYTWRPEGQLFPIREGKNFIGSGRVSSDTSHHECEIQIPIDDRMSSEHALILCRQDRQGTLRYDLYDQKSSNGTFLNEEMLLSPVPMEDQALIKTGDTLWQFFKIKPPKKSDIPKPREPRTVVQEESDKERGDTIIR